MLMLLTLLVLGMVWVASAIVDNNKASRESLYGEKTSFLPTPTCPMSWWAASSPAAG